MYFKAIWGIIIRHPLDLDWKFNFRTYWSKSSTNSTILRRSMSVPFRWKNVNIGWSSPGSWPLIPLLITTQETSTTIKRYQSRRVSGNGGTFLMIIRTPHFVTQKSLQVYTPLMSEQTVAFFIASLSLSVVLIVACSLHNIRDTPYQKATLISFNWLVLSNDSHKKKTTKKNRQCYITLLQWC